MVQAKHGITTTHEFAEPDTPEDGDWNRLARFFVAKADDDRAHRLFYAQREDEL